MKTICIVHGVGYGGAGNSQLDFGAKLAKLTGANCIYYNWNHTEKPPVHGEGPSWPYNLLRDFTNEVVMDFAYVLDNLTLLAKKMPVADMYIGHSAGAVICEERGVVAKVLLGSPAQLVRSAQHARQAIDGGHNTVNIINPYDIIASPSMTAKNVYVKFSGISWPFINLWRAHTGYWTSDKVLNITAAWYQKHVG